MVKIGLCDVDHVGILQREGWMKASVVPIPLKAHLLEYTENNTITAGCLDVEEWVRCPTESGRWSRHVKSLMRTPPYPRRPRWKLALTGSRSFVESVSDVLFLKIRDQTVVDVEETRVNRESTRTRLRLSKILH